MTDKIKETAPDVLDAGARSEPPRRAGDTAPSSSPGARETAARAAPAPAQRQSAEPPARAPIGKTSDLDSLLSEFDRLAGPASPTPQQPAPQRPQYEPDDYERVLARHEAETRPNERRAAEERILLNAALQLDIERSQIARSQHDNQVANSLVAEFAPTLQQLRISPTEIVQRLQIEAQRDPNLRHAIENRFAGPAENQRAIIASRTAIEKVVNEIGRRGVYDEAATEDRALVSQSLRGGRSTPPPEQPVRLGRMSDGDAKGHVKAKYGYEPNY